MMADIFAEPQVRQIFKCACEKITWNQSELPKNSQLKMYLSKTKQSPKFLELEETKLWTQYVFLIKPKESVKVNLVILWTSSS